MHRYDVMSHLSKESARDRAREYRNAEFYEDGGILFSKVCAKSVDHRRKSTIDDHVMSNGHRMNADKFKRRQEETQRGNNVAAGCSGLQQGDVRLQMLDSVVTAREARMDVVTEFLEALIVANISLEKVGRPKMKNFLETRVTNGGSIPGQNALRRRISEPFEKHGAWLNGVGRQCR
ncbi:CGG triplet repeat-binding protein 1-like [Ornithodoros turicata]|uniref:CGG triplet repeat-binding protein 1-like n=1 Tax=Ornithodoros turicata TaxID=34597 RepID=UPI0031394939